MTPAEDVGRGEKVGSNWLLTSGSQVRVLLGSPLLKLLRSVAMPIASHSRVCLPLLPIQSEVKPMKRQILVTLLVICAASIAEAQQSVRRAIEANNKQFIEAFNKGDAAAVANMYAIDARVLPPNSEIVEGRANIQQFWQGAMSSGLKLVSLETMHVETQGNVAVEVGRYASTIPGAGGSTTTDKGKYVVAWKRQGGSWKLAVDIFNTSIPATATP
jgi:uncharacterized protein (TIGR02246 family)